MWCEFVFNFLFESMKKKKKMNIIRGISKIRKTNIFKSLIRSIELL